MVKINHSLKNGGGILLKEVVADILADGIRLFHCGEIKLRNNNLFPRLEERDRVRRLTEQEQSEILRSSSADLLQSDGLSLRMTSAFDNHSKCRHPERSEGSLTKRIGNFPSPREVGVGEGVLSFAKLETLNQVQGDIIKKSAFTLAEVLITLGIIGVVAAITIPSLVTKYHRHIIETKLQKFDSIMNQAVRLSIAENGDIFYDSPADKDTNAAYLKEWFDEYLMKYIKANYEGEIIGNKYYKVSFIDGTGFVSYMPNDGGAIYFFFCSDVKDKSCHIESFDGKRTFLFDYSPDKKAILPHGYTMNDVEKLKYLDNGTTGCYVSTKANRHLCTQLIKLNGWKIPNDYPWIK